MCRMHESCRHDGVAVCRDGNCRLLIPEWTPQAHTLNVCLRLCEPSSQAGVLHMGGLRPPEWPLFSVIFLIRNRRGCPKLYSFFRQVCCCCFQLFLEVEVGFCDHLRSFKWFGILRQVDFPRADRHSLEILIALWRDDLLQLLIFFA